MGKFVWNIKLVQKLGNMEKVNIELRVMCIFGKYFFHGFTDLFFSSFLSLKTTETVNALRDKIHNIVFRRCVSVQGPSKDSVFVVFEDESFRETLLTSSAVVKWDSLAFGAFPGCVVRCFTLTLRFLLPRPAKVMIYATRCRHFSSFSGAQRILGYVRPRRIVAVHPPETGNTRSIWRSFRLGQPSHTVVM